MIIDLRQGAADLRADLHDLLGRVDDQVSHAIQDLRDHLAATVSRRVSRSPRSTWSRTAPSPEPHRREPGHAWGASYTPTGPFWISDNGTGVTTLYDGSGNAFPAGNPLVVTIPAPPRLDRAIHADRAGLQCRRHRLRRCRPVPYGDRRSPIRPRRGSSSPPRTGPSPAGTPRWTPPTRFSRWTIRAKARSTRGWPSPAITASNCSMPRISMAARSMSTTRTSGR